MFHHEESRIPLVIGGKYLSVEVADTIRKRKQGLSGLRTLEADNGLLFMFEKKGYYPFWMKEMLFPIDIIWIDDERRVADITEHITPDTFPQTFTSRLPIRYVLEVPIGFVEKNSIIIGDQVKW